MRVKLKRNFRSTEASGHPQSRAVLGNYPLCAHAASLRCLPALRGVRVQDAALALRHTSRNASHSRQSRPGLSTALGRSPGCVTSLRACWLYTCALLAAQAWLASLPDELLSNILRRIWADMPWGDDVLEVVCGAIGLASVCCRVRELLRQEPLPLVLDLSYSEAIVSPSALGCLDPRRPACRPPFPRVYNLGKVYN
jgi:hypothetical protein